MTAPTIAAGMVETPLTGRPPKPAIPACQTSGRNTVSGVGPGGAGGACGWDAQASPAVPCQVCGDPAVAGDDLALCAPHGGLSWAGFDEAAWLAGREAC